METTHTVDRDEKEEPNQKRRRQSKQIAPSKRWRFVDQDASIERQHAWRMKVLQGIQRLAFQVDICPTTMKEHIQGVFELYKKGRPSSFPKGPLYQKLQTSTDQAVASATNPHTRKPGTQPFVHNYNKPQGIKAMHDLCKKLATTAIVPKPPHTDAKIVQWLMDSDEKLQSMLPTTTVKEQEAYAEQLTIYKTILQRVGDTRISNIDQLTAFYTMSCQEFEASHSM